MFRQQLFVIPLCVKTIRLYSNSEMFRKWITDDCGFYSLLASAVHRSVGESQIDEMADIVLAILNRAAENTGSQVHLRVDIIYVWHFRDW